MDMVRRNHTYLRYLLFMVVSNRFTPEETFKQACQKFNVDVDLITALYATRYLNGRDHCIRKSGQMHLAWENGKRWYLITGNSASVMMHDA